MSAAAPNPDRRRGAAWRTPGARVIQLAVGLAALVVAGQAAWLAAGGPPDPVRSPAALVAVGLLFALAEKFVVTFPVRRGSHTLSLSEIPLVLGLVLLDPAPLLAVRVAGAVLGLTVFRRQRGSKLGFNLALYATQITVAAAVFHLVTGSADPHSPLMWAAAFAATFAADLVSIVLITAVIALHDDNSEWHRLLTADIKNLFQLPLVAVTTTLGLVTALVVREEVRAALLLGVLSVAIYLAFRRYAQQTRGHAQVEELYAFTRALGGSHDPDDVARIVLSRARDLLRAESATLVVAGAGPAAPAVRIRLSGRGEFSTAAADAGPDPWWGPARTGATMLLPASPQRAAAGPAPADAMAVPVALNDATGVLIVTDSLPDLPTFTAEHLRLMQALAAHAGVALTNVRLVDRLRHIGLHDALTDLPNRRQFLAHLQDATDAITATPCTVGVLLLDLERFKEVNNALGHDVGDGLLREVARRLTARVGARGTVARLGGDEFAVVIPRAWSTDEILALADDLRRSIEEPVSVGDLTLTTRASVGVCFAPEHGVDADRLLQRADIALYAAKQTRAGTRVHRPEDDHGTRRRLALMGDLREAIADRTLTVAYQPKVDPATGAVLGAEALARWQHAEGTVPPDEFIPLAERAGLIRPLTNLILDTALAACAGWHRAGHPISVAVNLSPRVLADPLLAEDVLAALRTHGLPAGALTLEITENGMMDDPARGRATLAALADHGIRLSIDDFGTGHSSLGRIAELPIHEMKIDKTFIRDLPANTGTRAVTDASLELGRALGLTVVAEGVEREQEYAYLRAHGCDAIQGYWIARPMPGAAFLTWLADPDRLPAAARPRAA
ncbi:hypothetical protein GCM10010123_05580 [Pilimelia anulata]|uniref:Diguanylate cyclase/phosphodiesterase n=1 Tax=Pilimelia anulata TaxID=53371 RepID=A0A8J3B7G4_9ACTN|nr:GGDEF domain-containing protein [Pilimelia anulata]GGJ78493.1 hypothetical protein GCM10010123_05580 [Pilimelia anulata]